jgi:hypothetical protein
MKSSLLFWEQRGRSGFHLCVRAIMTDERMTPDRAWAIIAVIANQFAVMRRREVTMAGVLIDQMWEDWQAHLVLESVDRSDYLSAEYLALCKPERAIYRNDAKADIDLCAVLMLENHPELIKLAAKFDWQARNPESDGAAS